MANEDQDTVQYEDWEMVNLIDRHDKSKCVLLVSLTSSWQNCNLTKDFTFISSQHVSTTSALFTWWF